MTQDRLRGDQVRQAIVLLEEAREIPSSADRRLHVLRGVQRIVGSAMTSVGTFCAPAAVNGRSWLEEEVTIPDGPPARTLIGAVRRGLRQSPGICAILPRLVASSMVTARRRDLLADQDWYGSRSYNELHVPLGFDDFLYSFRRIGRDRVSGFGIRREAKARPFDDEDRNVLHLLHEEIARIDSAPTPRSGVRLTPRETEVLDALLGGASEKEVAADLGIGPQTVHSHVKSIYRAHGVSSRGALLALCLSGTRRSPPNQLD